MSTDIASTPAATALPAALTATVPIASALETGHAAITTAAATLELNLAPGDHVAHSDAVVIGQLKDFGQPEIAAVIELHYRFDPAVPQLTLFAPDLDQDEAPRVRTMLSGANGTALTTARSAADLGTARWHPASPLTPGLADMLRQSLKVATDRLIEQALAAGINVELRDRFPELDADTYARLCMVYENGEFKEMYDPSRTYGPGTEFFHVESTYVGLYYFAQNASFANVRGSTSDPKINNKLWIQLWRTKTQRGTPACSSTNYPANFNCNTPIVGGHVLAGTVAGTPPKGGDCYIIPICQRHNVTYSTWMEARTNQEALSLTNFNRSSLLQTFLV